MEIFLLLVSYIPYKVFALVFLGSPWLLYFFYRLVMRILRNNPDRKFVWYQYPYVVPVVVIGYLLDIFVNYVVASFWLKEFPKSWKEEKTLSERLSRYKLTDCGWRSTITAWIGPKLLDKWDPKGIHIGYVKPKE